RRLDGELGARRQPAAVVARRLPHFGSRPAAIVSLRIREFYATQAFYHPAESLTFRAEIESSGRRQVHAVLSLARPGGVAREQRETIRLPRGITAIDFSMNIPTQAPHGYLVDLVLEDDSAITLNASPPPMPCP